MEDEIYLSYVVVANDDSEEARLYANSIYGASIKSLNEIDIYYAGSTSDTQVFDVEEGEKYEIELKTRDKTYTLKKGRQIDLVQSVNYGYWQLYEEVNTSLQKAEIEGFKERAPGCDQDQLYQARVPYSAQQVEDFR